jgi:RND family efflux transporter MFP subunit
MGLLDRWNRPTLAVLATSAALLGLGGCQGHDGEAPAPTGTSVAAQVVAVASGTIAETDVVPGSVVAEQRVEVASRLMGYIRTIAVNEGDAVKPGQLLFSIDPTDIQGQVNQARAGVAQADAALADAKTDFERFANLYKDESVSRQTYEKMELKFRVAQSQATAARAGLQTADAQLHYADVRSPIDGIVSQKLAASGDLAAPGRPVLVVENPARLQIQTAVSDATFAHLKLGDVVSIEVDGSPTPIEARIARLVAAADAASHTHLVKLDLPATAGLRSGAFARAYFVTGSREGVRVPEAALQRRAGIAGVMVIDDQGIAHYRMVSAGTRSGGMVEIQAGLSGGERIALDAAGALNSGDHVTPAGSR